LPVRNFIPREKGGLLLGLRSPSKATPSKPLKIECEEIKFKSLQDKRKKEAFICVSEENLPTRLKQLVTYQRKAVNHVSFCLSVVNLCFDVPVLGSRQRLSL
jgi:hypothetical protein